MDLDFLDHGIPVEPEQGEQASEGISAFLHFCRTLHKTPDELTDDERRTFYQTQ